MVRARLVSAGKIAALAIFVSVVASLAVYLVVRDRRPRGTGDRPKLQGQVVAVFNNTRYAHEVEGRVRFVLTAGTDRTYEDGTHELEQVRLESHGNDVTRVDLVTADRAKVSDTANLNRLDAEFISNVLVQTSEGLVIRTNYLRYSQTENSVETKEPLEFQYRNMSGRATGMGIEAAAERVHLLKDVDVAIKPARPGGNKQSKEPVHIRSESALLEKKQRRVTFTGGVVVTSGTDEARASRMIGYTNDANRIERIEARGNSYLKARANTEIESADMDFFFGEGQGLVRAVATGQVHARSLEDRPLREARADLIEVGFEEGPSGNTARTLKAAGNAVVNVHPPFPQTEATRNPAERELAAKVIALELFPDGKNIKTAEASENAVMTVTPVRAERGADKKTIRAPLMSAVFFEEGNRIKRFNASGGVEVEIEATIAGAHPVRVTTSRVLAADFASGSQDVERIEQEGDFKYNEGDRNATAERGVYDGRRELLSLRGKRPMAWDSKGRTQANEIDYDRQRDETHARGEVRTTYYSREATNDSTPFKKSKSPIFVTADRADARHADGIAIYSGNARGWQDDNFVKADRIELYDKDKRMIAIGHVESALYTVERETSPGRREVVPGFASADSLVYSDLERLVHYEGQVKARQGTDRMEAAEIDAYLKEGANEMERLAARGNVALSQPGRRGVGDSLDYNAEDGRAVLAGKNARIDDDEKGAIMGAQLTFYSHDDKILAQNQNGTGRVRSIHRLTKSKEKR